MRDYYKRSYQDEQRTEIQQRKQEKALVEPKGKKGPQEKQKCREEGLY
jgi:hypothetical protein